MPENTNPIESQIESGESRGSEQQSLNDATFEPQSFVEQTSDYKQSEAVQQNFETLVGNTTATENTADIPATAKDEVSDGKSKGTAKDRSRAKGERARAVHPAENLQIIRSWIRQQRARHLSLKYPIQKKSGVGLVPKFPPAKLTEMTLSMKWTVKIPILLEVSTRFPPNR
jgi:hypothetical protein